jgi:tellurite resistance protein
MSEKPVHLELVVPIIPPPAPGAPDSATGLARCMEYLPVALFASVMGLAGLSASWREAAGLYGFPAGIAEGIGLIAILSFAALVIAYGMKIVFAYPAVRAEFGHPIIGSLFSTAIISLLLLPAVIASMSLRLAQGMWVAGAVLMLGFAWFVVYRWMGNRQQVSHAAPAWIVPVVGLLDVPLAVPGLTLPPMHGLMVACLAIGLFFAIPLFTMIFSRLLFEPPLPDALQPTLLILVAPFAVGFLAYVSVNGSVDIFAEGLFGLTLFMLTILVGRLRWMLMGCPFRLTWWAVSFPIASAALASLHYAAARPNVISHSIALSLLTFATVVIGALLVRTAVGISRGELKKLGS